MKKISNTLRLAAASLLILTACADARPPATGQDTAVTSLWQQIKTANADLSCDNSSQCHSLGIGARACGGPENYLAWSSKNHDGARLKELVAQHSAVSRDEDKRKGMMSTCSVVSDPGASCRAGACTLNPQSLASPGQPNSK